jgi:ligand-binding SRPBCC domain-containing protein
MPASAEALYAYHAAPGAFLRLTPPWEQVQILREEGPFETRKVTLRVGPFPGLTWVAQHGDAEAGRRFTDRQERGPFASWIHTHHFEPAGAQSELFDSIRYALPFGPFGAVGAGMVERKLQRMFAYRHAVTAADLARHTLAGTTRFAVTLSGGDRLAEKALGAFLLTGGHTLQPQAPIQIALSHGQAVIVRPQGTVRLGFGRLVGSSVPPPSSGGRDNRPAWLALDDAIGAVHFTLLHPELQGDLEVTDRRNDLAVHGFIPRLATLEQALAFQVGPSN